MIELRYVPRGNVQQGEIADTDWNVLANNAIALSKLLGLMPFALANTLLFLLLFFVVAFVHREILLRAQFLSTRT